MPAPHSRNEPRYALWAAVITALGALLAALITKYGLPSFSSDRSPSRYDGGVPDAFLGKWRGDVTEEGVRPSVYAAAVSIGEAGPGGEAGSIEYTAPGLLCKGVLVLQEVGDDRGTITLGEEIRSGRCVPRGRITLTAGTERHVTFFYTGKKHDGTLQVVRGGLDKGA
ncbi:hypothetical protein [Streptomyces griseocarneus]|uniref:hypothetical protein n=1 Tax=Streptomyces griseocarneus TaxID=51201 RepID=UPI00167E0E41|nr:hypothetical protein [Streptomyces griseocarneus]MBZ6471915.1 hypothetical protein [Streptomyces griseocarneus]GHG71541.1 hypothetical protein GCM10018779_46370 [Streptomyces griseocarneus]